MRAAWLPLVGLGWLALVLLTCYEPRYAECVVRCAAETECAPGQTCGPDGWCASPARAGRCAELAPDAPEAEDAAVPADGRGPMPRPDGGMPPKPDAKLPIDARPPDAPSGGCAPGCPGTCESGVCVVRCTAPGSCKADVVCPVTGACRVECTGAASCEGDVICGLGRCTVTCSGAHSCEKVRCADACACDVACTGNGSCHKAAACPAPACKAGRGCSSLPSGCASC